MSDLVRLISNLIAPMIASSNGWSVGGWLGGGFVEGVCLVLITDSHAFLKESARTVSEVTVRDRSLLDVEVVHEVRCNLPISLKGGRLFVRPINNVCHIDHETFDNFGKFVLSKMHG